MSRLLVLSLTTTLLAACPGEGNAPSSDDPVDTPVSETDPPPESDPTDIEPPPLDTAPPQQADAWTIGEAVACADPTARPTRPYRLFRPGGAWDDQPVDRDSGALFVGGGFAVADFTGDGRLDLMVTHAEQAFRFWVQEADGTLTNATDRLPPMPTRTSGVTAVDHDGDGDMDAFVAVFRGPDLLLDNDGSGRFTDVAAALGLRGPDTRRSMSSSWGDLDGDGDLDAVVSGYGRLGGEGGLPEGDPSSVYLRDGRAYTDLVPTLTAPHPLLAAHTFATGIVDVDRDGLPELYMVNDFGWTWPALLLGDVPRTGLAVLQAGAELRRENMGLGIGDLNGDEVPDFLIAAWDDYGLFLSDASGGWFESSRAIGLHPEADLDRHVAWGVDLGDLDNDGDLDAVVAYGYLNVRSGNVNPLAQPDAVYLNGGDPTVTGAFTDVAAEWGLDDRGIGRGVLLVDFDRNGFLDVVRTDLQGPATIRLAACDDSAWLGLSLRQPGPNGFALGARIRVGLGERVLTRDVRAGGTGYTVAGPPEVHFGLGDTDVVDYLEVIWPDGYVSRKEAVPTRRFVQVERP